MISIRDILARTVSSSLLGTDVVVTFPTGDIATRGTWATIEDDATFLGGQGVGVDNLLRTPAGNLPSDPVKGTRILVDGVTYRVDDAHRRGANWLLALARVAVR